MLLLRAEIFGPTPLLISWASSWTPFHHISWTRSFVLLLPPFKYGFLSLLIFPQSYSDSATSIYYFSFSFFFILSVISSLRFIEHFSQRFSCWPGQEACTWPRWACSQLPRYHRAPDQSVNCKTYFFKIESVLRIFLGNFFCSRVEKRKK